MAGFDSLRVQRRWCGILLRVTWLLLIGAAGWGFYQSARTGLIVLIVGFSILIVEMLLRDNIVRRQEQRRSRKPPVTASRVTE